LNEYCICDLIASAVEKLWDATAWRSIGERSKRWDSIQQTRYAEWCMQKEIYDFSKYFKDYFLANIWTQTILLL